MIIQFKKYMKKRNEFQLEENSAYFFNNLERIGQKGYIPTEQDVIRSRVKTTGITEQEIDVSGKKVIFIDVGGQRNERKKWIHSFENVNALIFISSLSEYNQKCYEDDKTNRIQESLNLFEEIINLKWFISTPIILFLNKTDVFKEKIKKKMI